MFPTLRPFIESRNLVQPPLKRLHLLLSRSFVAQEEHLVFVVFVETLINECNSDD